MLRGLNRHHIRVIEAVASIESLRLLGIFFILPVFTIYGENFSNSGLLIGVAFGAYGAAMALFQIPFGIVSDHIGRKKTLIIGMIPFVIGNLMCWHPINIYILIAGRFIAGAGAITSVSVALLQESIPEHRRNIAMAIVGIPVGLVFMVGVLVGPVISLYLGTSYIFLITAALGAIAFIPIASLKETRNPMKNYALKGKRRRIAAITPSSLKFGAISFVVSALMFSYFYYLSQFHQQYIPKVSLTTLLLVPVLVGGFVAVVLSRYADKGKTTQVTVACLSLLLVSVPAVFVLAYLYHNSVMIVVGSVIFFAGYSVYEIAFPTLVAKHSPRGSYGSNLGVYNVLQFSGQLGGSLVAGIFIGKYIYGNGPYITALIFVIALFLSMGILRDILRRVRSGEEDNL